MASQRIRVQSSVPIVPLIVGAFTFLDRNANWNDAVSWKATLPATTARDLPAIVFAIAEVSSARADLPLPM